MRNPLWERGIAAAFAFIDCTGSWSYTRKMLCLPSVNGVAVVDEEHAKVVAY